MVTLHFESTDKKMIEQQNFNWASLFVGAKSYVEDDIMVTSIEHEKLRLDLDDPETEFDVYKFDVIFNRDSATLDNVCNGKEVIFFD